MGWPSRRGQVRTPSFVPLICPVLIHMFMSHCQGLLQPQHRRPYLMASSLRHLRRGAGQAARGVRTARRSEVTASACRQSWVRGVSNDAGYREDIHLSIKDNLLTLSALKPQTRREEGGFYHQTERHFGRFYRRILLPYNVDADNVKAHMDGGVLKVTPRGLRLTCRRASCLLVVHATFRSISTFAAE